MENNHLKGVADRFSLATMNICRTMLERYPGQKVGYQLPDAEGNYQRSTIVVDGVPKGEVVMDMDSMTITTRVERPAEGSETFHPFKVTGPLAPEPIRGVSPVRADSKSDKNG